MTTISLEEKVYGITEEELNQILATEYTTIESIPENVPAFLDDISKVEAELDEVPEFYPEEPEIIDFPIYSEMKETA